MRQVRGLDSGDPQTCPNGTWPDEASNFTLCANLTVETLDPGDPWAVFALLVTWSGLALVAAFAIFTARHFDHEVVRSASRELSAFTVAGVFICHVNALLVFYSPPGVFSCGLMRLTMTVGYTMILSSLCLKTNRLFLIFYAQFKKDGGVLGMPKYASPKHQVLKIVF
jgi:uncharacterized Tic20 family protein